MKRFAHCEALVYDQDIDVVHAVKSKTYVLYRALKNCIFCHPEFISGSLTSIKTGFRNPERSSGG
jgi:hypothetical protein